MRELAADRDDEIRALDDRIEYRSVLHAGIAHDHPGVVLGNHAACRRRRDNGGAGCIGQRSHGFHAVEYARAEVEQDARSGVDRFRDLVQERFARFGRHRHRRNLRAGRAFRGKELFRHLEHHRAGFAGDREPIGIGGAGCDPSRVGHPEDPLDDRSGHRALVYRLQRVLAVRYLARRRKHVHDWDGVEPGFRETGQCVGEAGPRNRRQDAGPAAHARIAVRHEGGRHLVRRHDRAQAASLQRLECVDRLRPGQPENAVRAQDAEGGPELFADRARHVSLFCSGS